MWDASQHALTGLPTAAGAVRLLVYDLSFIQHNAFLNTSRRRSALFVAWTLKNVVGHITNFDQYLLRFNPLFLSCEWSVFYWVPGIHSLFYLLKSSLNFFKLGDTSVCFTCQPHAGLAGADLLRELANFGLRSTFTYAIAKAKQEKCIGKVYSQKLAAILWENGKR